MDLDKDKRVSKTLLTITLMSILTPSQESLYKQRESTHKTGTDDEKFLKMGMKKHFYGDDFVWASSKKSAEKKAKKLGYI